MPKLYFNKLLYSSTPNFFDLISSFILKKKNDKELSSPWCHKRDVSYWLSKSSWSLEVIVRWRQKLTHKNKITIWIPDYFCNTSLDFVRKLGVDLFFYPLKANLLPDIDACIAASNHTSLDIFLHVHYFGLARDAEASGVFCKTQNAWLIEDAAHVFLPTLGVGETGDFVLYSPHKHLPIPDGALLVVRENGISDLKLNDDSLQLLEACLQSQKNVSPKRSIRRLLFWLLKRIAQRLGLRSILQQKCINDLSDNKGVISVHSEMSQFSKRLLGVVLPKLDQYAQMRKENALAWSVALHTATEVVPDNLNSEETFTPYLTSFHFSNNLHKSEAFKSLQSSGYPVTTWPDLPPEVIANRVHHGIALDNRLGHFFLPVHHSLSSRDILNLARVQLHKEMRKWSMREIHKEEFEYHKKKCQKSNLLQSWEYGSAKEIAEDWQAKRFLVEDGKSQPVALLQVLVKSIPFIGLVVRINRGPLIISVEDDEVDATNTAIKILGVLFVVSRSMVRNRWVYLQAAVELFDSEFSSQIMNFLGFKRKKTTPWASGYLDLSWNENELFMNLHGKWRNAMRKGERLGVIVRERSSDKSDIQLLLNKYSELQGDREFVGLSDGMLTALANQSNDDWKFNFFEAVKANHRENEEPLGLLVSIHAGDTAIYLIGYANEQGRMMQCNSVLLWQAILKAKSCGCHWFDIGGLSKNTPKGIANFKKGLKATPYQLVGEWRYSPILNIFKM